MRQALFLSSVAAASGRLVEILLDDLHRAVVTAHGTGAFARVVSRLATCPRTRRINGERELRLPVERLSRLRHLPIPLRCTWYALDDVGCVRGNAACYHAVVYVLQRR